MRKTSLPAPLMRPLSPALRFGVSFAAWLMVSSILFWSFNLHMHLGWLQRSLAAAGALLDNLLGGSARAQDTDILLGTSTLNINHECTAIFLALLLASFILAYPATARARVVGLVGGLALLQVVNALRLGVLGRLLEVYPSAFFYFHEYVWQGVLMVLVILGCSAWAEQVDVK